MLGGERRAISGGALLRARPRVSARPIRRGVWLRRRRGWRRFLPGASCRIPFPAHRARGFAHGFSVAARGSASSEAASRAARASASCSASGAGERSDFGFQAASFRRPQASSSSARLASGRAGSAAARLSAETRAFLLFSALLAVSSAPRARLRALLRSAAALVCVSIQPSCSTRRRCAPFLILGRLRAACREVFVQFRSGALARRGPIRFS